MRTYWFRRGQNYNLGDELGPLILKRRYECNPIRSGFDTAEMISVGSILGWLSNYSYDNRVDELHVVGSGFISSKSELPRLPFLRIHSVRGYLTKHLLRSHDNPGISVGDPGLLTPLICDHSTATREGRYGVVLHAKFSGNKEIEQQFSHLPVDFIDIRTDDIDGFVNQMRKYDIILSQSLHGLIIADSLGIPNVWLNTGNQLSGGNFKFHDYNSTVGKSFYTYIHGIPSSVEQIESAVQLAPEKRVASLQRDISDSYDRAFTELHAPTSPPQKLFVGSHNLQIALQLPLSEPTQNFRVEIAGSSGDEVEYKDLALKLRLEAPDGSTLSDRVITPNVSYSDRRGLGYYTYLPPLSPGQREALVFRLPKNVRCTQLTLVKWINKERPTEINEVILTKL